jgi:hypothetical protein
MYKPEVVVCLALPLLATAYAVIAESKIAAIIKKEKEQITCVSFHYLIMFLAVVSQMCNGL